MYTTENSQLRKDIGRRDIKVSFFFFFTWRSAVTFQKAAA